MKVKNSRLLVVDASVAHSAGETEHPMSRSCREVLVSIRDICHRMVLTQAIQEEWSRHESNFARRWRVSMYARKKIVPLEGMQIDLAEKTLRGLSANERENLRKDMCLIEAACGGDGIVVTRDDVIVAIWQKWQDGFNLPKAIRWINPVTDDRQVLEHL
jgi:hypothetical protein